MPGANSSGEASKIVCPDYIVNRLLVPFWRLFHRLVPISFLWNNEAFHYCPCSTFLFHMTMATPDCYNFVSKYGGSRKCRRILKQFWKLFEQFSDIPETVQGNFRNICPTFQSSRFSHWMYHFLLFNVLNITARVAGILREIKIMIDQPTTREYAVYPWPALIRHSYCRGFQISSMQLFTRLEHKQRTSTYCLRCSSR